MPKPRSRSTMLTSRPDRAGARATARPTTPAPTTIVSAYSICGDSTRPFGRDVPRETCAVLEAGSSSGHPDDLPNRLSSRQPIERRVNLVERGALRQETIDGKPPRTVQRNETGDVAGRNARTEIAALHGPLLADQGHRLQRPARVRIRQSGGNRG